ncbi:hypothetical protein [Salinivirga cyanobacteriivorans]
MRRLVYILLFLFLVSFSGVYGQRDSQFKREKEKVFKKNNFGKNNTSGTRAGPPDPGGGSGGNPVPISGGAVLLAGGLFLYSIYRTRKKDV